MQEKTVLSVYSAIADWFDAARDKSVCEKVWLDVVLTKLPPSAAVLDLGCGTGEPIAKYLIDAQCRITGVDGSEAMIAYCKKRFPGHRWILQDMRTFESTEIFDAVIAWDSFFHLSGKEQRNMFPLFARHCRPGGVLVFSSGTAEGESWSPMHGHDTAEMYHASLDTSEYQALLQRHGFTVVKYVQSDPACGWHTYWIAEKTGTVS